VVLDLGVEVPCRLRSHVWPRLMRAAEQSHTAAIVLAPHRMAGSFSVLGLGVRSRAVHWQPGAWPLFEGFDSIVELTRTKLGAPGKQIVVRARVRARGKSQESHLYEPEHEHEHDSR